MKGLLIPAVAVMALSACTQQRDLAGYDDGDRYALNDDFLIGQVTESNLPLTQSTLVGDLGELRGFEHQATARGYAEDGLALFDIVSTGPDGSAMQMITVYGDIEAFQPGYEATYRFDSPHSEGKLEAIVCSGQDDPGLWSYDQEAEQVSVMVNEVPGRDDVVAVDFVTVSEGGDVATGSALLGQQ